MYFIFQTNLVWILTGVSSELLFFDFSIPASFWLVTSFLSLKFYSIFDYFYQILKLIVNWKQ